MFNHLIIAAEPTGTTLIARDTAMREDVARQVFEDFTHKYPGKRIILADKWAKPVKVIIAPNR
jgi:hypothetical protein